MNVNRNLTTILRKPHTEIEFWKNWKNTFLAARPSSTWIIMFFLKMWILIGPAIKGLFTSTRLLTVWDCCYLCLHFHASAHRPTQPLQCGLVQYQYPPPPHPLWQATSVKYPNFCYFLFVIMINMVLPILLANHCK